MLSGCKYPEETSRGFVKNRQRYKQLSQDLEQSFADREFTDCKIVCREKEFHCHQFMLSARSPVFRAMFQNNMEEANSKKVEIEVSFIYTWCVQQIGIACSEGIFFLFCGKKMIIGVLVFWTINMMLEGMCGEGVLMLEIHNKSTYSSLKNYSFIASLIRRE